MLRILWNWITTLFRSKEEDVIINLYNSLNDEDKKKADKYLDSLIDKQEKENKKKAP